MGLFIMPGVMPTHQLIRVTVVASDLRANAQEDPVDSAMQIHAEMVWCWLRCEASAR